MTYPTQKGVQIGNHILKTSKKIVVNVKNLAYPGFFLLFSSI